MALMGDYDRQHSRRARSERQARAGRTAQRPASAKSGARQLIQQFGSAEAVLKRAAEVKRASYREALEKNARVRAAEQAARDDSDRCARAAGRSRNCRFASRMPQRCASSTRSSGFTSLLKELAVSAARHGGGSHDGLRGAGFARGARRFPGGGAARARNGRVARARFRRSGRARDSDARAGRGGVGEGGRGAYRSRMMPTIARSRAMSEWLADPKRPKVVHDPKLFHLLAAPRCGGLTPQAVAGIRHATILYSYLLRPTTANHAFAEVVLRHMNRTLSGAPGERADFLLRLAPAAARGSGKAGPRRALRENRSAAGAGAGANGSGRRAGRRAGTGKDFRESRRRKSARSRSESTSWRDSNSISNRRSNSRKCFSTS